MTFCPGLKVKQLFRGVIYKFCNKLECLFLARFFKLVSNFQVLHSRAFGLTNEHKTRQQNLAEAKNSSLKFR
jgi:hypothetical protein